jgi:hypothetical protein
MRLAMLRDVLIVRDEVVRRCKGREIDIETVATVISDATAIDEIVYVEVDTPHENPIIGRFRRYPRSAGVYIGPGTIAEIEYAKHLDVPWRKLVVVKEACHALGATEGVHMVADNALANLVVQFAAHSNTGNLTANDIVVELEILAEIGAIEILCPYHERLEILTQTPNPDLGQMAKRFNIPIQTAGRAFSPAYIRLVGVLLDNGN